MAITVVDHEGPINIQWTTFYIVLRKLVKFLLGSEADSDPPNAFIASLVSLQHLGAIQTFSGFW